MSDLMVYLVSSVSLTMIIVDAKIFSKPKYNLAILAGWMKKAERTRMVRSCGDFLAMMHYLLSCYQCTGVWVGMMIGWHLDPLKTDIIYYGLIASLVSVVVVYMINLMDRTTKLLSHCAGYVYDLTRNGKTR